MKTFRKKNVKVMMESNIGAFELLHPTRQEVSDFIFPPQNVSILHNKVL